MNKNGLFKHNRIDIAVPCDIHPDVQHLDNVYLYNIDHFETLVRRNL